MHQKKHSKNKSNNRHQNNKVRITGGQLRGRILTFATLDGLRPSGDRSRETLFNWLMPHIAERRVLDAFAGSGILGFEALSRGARKVIFLDQSQKVTTQINQYCQLFNQQAQSQIIQTDTLTWLENCSKSFDLIFLDPPFAADSCQQLLNIIQNQKLLNKNGLIYLEQDKSALPLSESNNWHILKQKEMGQVRLTLISFDLN